MTTKDIIAQVNEYRDRPISIREIAHRLGMSVAELLAILNKQKG